jgi:Protein of unknown function (DUF3300)
MNFHLFSTQYIGDAQSRNSTTSILFSGASVLLIRSVAESSGCARRRAYMKPNSSNSRMSWIAGILLTAVFTAGPAAAQSQQYPEPQYPQTQQYPPAQQGQYPQQQGPPPEGQYPPQQGQYPPTQYPPTQYPPQAQYPPPQGYSQPPVLSPAQLDPLAGPVALYPDGLLAQVLTAATFYQQIPEAAAWGNQHSYLRGPALSQAIQQDALPWDPSVIALLPFPNVLNQLANNMAWTQALGNAVLAQRPDVMDAVQRMRERAYDYGYLRSNQYDRVDAAPGAIEIVPVQPDYYYVPYYDPYVVYARPRPGFFVGGAIRFGPGIVLGASFAPWGWGGVGFGWHEHTIVVDHHPWVRTWNNRTVYVHPYAAAPRRYEPGVRYQEHHELRGPAHYEERHEEHRGEHEHDRH